MQEYDVALKLLLQGSPTLTMRELTGTTVAKWLNVELPKLQNAQNLRLDLLAETVDGGLVHVELQSSNDAAIMSVRRACKCRANWLARACISNTARSISARWMASDSWKAMQSETM
jgi:hypothetical protein